MTTGDIRRAKPQSNRHNQETNITFYRLDGYPSCRSTRSVKALKGKEMAVQCTMKTVITALAKLSGNL